MQTQSDRPFLRDPGFRDNAPSANGTSSFRLPLNAAFNPSEVDWSP